LRGSEDGIEAVRHAERANPDVIILDLLMPGLNGFNAAKQIREVLPDTPIVLLTLYDNRQVKLEAERCGISTVISKTQPGRPLAVLDEALNSLAQLSSSNG